VLMLGGLGGDVVIRDSYATRLCLPKTAMTWQLPKPPVRSKKWRRKETANRVPTHFAFQTVDFSPQPARPLRTAGSSLLSGVGPSRLSRNHKRAITRHTCRLGDGRRGAEAHWQGRKRAGMCVTVREVLAESGKARQRGSEAQQPAPFVLPLPATCVSFGSKPPSTEPGVYTAHEGVGAM